MGISSSLSQKNTHVYMHACARDAAFKLDAAENSQEIQRAIVSDFRRKIDTFREWNAKNVRIYEEIADEMERCAAE